MIFVVHRFGYDDECHFIGAFSTKELAERYVCGHCDYTITEAKIDSLPMPTIYYFVRVYEDGRKEAYKCRHSDREPFQEQQRSNWDWQPKHTRGEGSALTEHEAEQIAKAALAIALADKERTRQREERAKEKDRVMLCRRKEGEFDEFLGDEPPNAAWFL